MYKRNKGPKYGPEVRSDHPGAHVQRNSIGAGRTTKRERKPIMILVTLFVLSMILPISGSLPSTDIVTAASVPAPLGRAAGHPLDPPQLPDFKFPYDRSLTVYWTGGPHGYREGADLTAIIDAGNGSGLDFAKDGGFDVLAMASGTVIGSLDCYTGTPSLGCHVAIKHDVGGTVMIYSHLEAGSSARLGITHVGQHVSQGDPVGRTGSTGTDKVHLHIEFRLGNDVCHRECLPAGLGGDPVGWDDLIPFVDGYYIGGYWADEDDTRIYNYDGSAVRGTPLDYWQFPYDDSGIHRFATLARVSRDFACDRNSPTCELNNITPNVQFALTGVLGQQGADGSSKGQGTTSSAPDSEVGGILVSTNVAHYPAQPSTTPVSTATPTGDPVTVISVYPQGTNFDQGQQFHPEVVIQTNGLSLDCSQDFLENRDGNLYNTWPTQGCEDLGNHRYRIYFNTPMQAPSSSGTFHSLWAAWHYPQYLNPAIDIWFRVGQPNHAPTVPQLVSPGDWSEVRSELAPQLCWNPSTDPDGDPVRYWVQVRGAVIQDSGWITDTCFRPNNLDHQYFGYGWKVKAQDNRGGETDWSPEYHFTLSPPAYAPPHPASTPPAVPALPVVNGYWWMGDAYAWRAVMPISTDHMLPAGTMMTLSDFDLSSLVDNGRALPNLDDVRVVHMIDDQTWQEVARVIYSNYDLEFVLPQAVDQALDNSYYLYFGNPNAVAPPIFTLTSGLKVDLHLSKWWDSYFGTYDLDGPIDYADTCGPPVDHRTRTGSSFDDSDVYWGRIFIPATGTWTFREYTADGWELSIDGAQVGRFDGYDGNRWVTVGSIELRAGWHEFEVHDMWVNCNAMRLTMSGPGFPDQIVPANYFQKWWGNLKSGFGIGTQEPYTQITPTYTPTTVPTSTPANTATSTSTPISVSFEDVPEGSTFYTYIQCLASVGILSGYADGTFKPNNLVTRGQIAKILSNTMGFAEPAGNQAFQDVVPGSTFYDYVQRMVLHQVVGGYDCGGPGEPCAGPANLPYFRPSGTATRGQISKMVVSSLGISAMTSGGPHFTDVPVGSTFYDYVETLYHLDAISGYSDGTFKPGNTATRGQVSKIVSSAILPSCSQVR